MFCRVKSENVPSILESTEGVASAYEEEEDIFAAFYGEEIKTVLIQEDVAERFNRAIRGYRKRCAGRQPFCIVRSRCSNDRKIICDI